LTDNHQPFPEDLFSEVSLRLRQQFGGTTWMQPVRELALLGAWLELATGQVCWDEVIAYFTLADPTPATESFFTSLKQFLKEQFRQEEILLMAFPVELF